MKVQNVTAAAPAGKYSKYIQEEHYIGAVDKDDIEALRADPRKFLKRAGVKVTPKQEIQVSIEELAQRTLARSAKGGTRPIKDGDVAAQRGGGGVEVIGLCRVYIIIIDGIVIVAVRCIPIVIISCW
jgi:hypothetical protein